MRLGRLLQREDARDDGMNAPGAQVVAEARQE